MHKVHPLAWQAEPTDFATTHCMKCEAGWTRKRNEWSQGHRLSSRPGAGVHQYDRLRSLRAEGGGAPGISANPQPQSAYAGEVAPSSSLASELGGGKGLLRGAHRRRASKPISGGASRGYPGNSERTDARDPRHHRPLAGLFSEQEAEAAAKSRAALGRPALAALYKPSQELRIRPSFFSARNASAVKKVFYRYASNESSNAPKLTDLAAVRPVRAFELPVIS